MEKKIPPFNYSYQFPFERTYNDHDFQDYMQQYWTLSFVYAAVYVFLIFFGQWYMKDKQRFVLQKSLAIWSGFLSIFSILGAIRTIPEMIYVISNFGFRHSTCNSSYFYGPTGFWAFTFVISKVYELGDTFFIVLRKQPLIFLHWYHHMSVLVYVWYSYTDHTAPGRWFCVLNYTVHSFMYTYYAFKALRFRIPRWVSVCITSLQISQMLMGLFVNIYNYGVKSRGEFCQQTFRNLHYSLMMYFSYFVLFSYFFYKTYVKPQAVNLGIMQNGITKVNGKKVY